MGQIQTRKELGTPGPLLEPTPPGWLLGAQAKKGQGVLPSEDDHSPFLEDAEGGGGRPSSPCWPGWGQGPTPPGKTPSRMFTSRVTETIGVKHSALCLTRGSPAEVSGWAHGHYL